MSDYAGRTVGEFLLQTTIGSGGSATVMQAYQPILQRNAVVKLHHSEGDSKRIESFLQEARLASRLDHPFAAHVYAFGAESDGLLWIAMELVRGTPLDEVLDHGPLERGLVFIKRLCEVVQATHDHGIIHGDLKPSNIMVISRVGSLFPKLIDFGIARDQGDHVSDGYGTPQYMAAEQWVPGSVLTPMTDVYALGAIAYQILTGKPPFTGATRLAYATHHARTPPPALPEGFPQRFSTAIAKAMAKQPSQRFASAMEFSLSLTADADSLLSSINVARLDELTRDDALLIAPEPIAEAVARLDATNDPEAAYLALWRLTETIAHYIGVVALACRGRVRAAAVDSESIGKLFTTLRAEGLSAQGWWQLARELVRPFASVREVHPIPELVAMFFDGRAEVTTALDLVFAHGGAPIAQANREAAAAELTRIIPEIGVALRSLRWLDHYRLVVPARTNAHLWLGVRRRDRPIATLNQPLERPALLGSDGAIVVDLSDVVEVSEPVPGAARELFFLDGPGRHGVRFRAIPSDLEHEVVGTWERLGISGGSVEQDALGEPAAPYMGLSTFTEDQSALFFGRERELEELLNRIRTQSFLAVVGPSGAGKSSFVRAGLFPSLGKDWRTVALRPGTAPLANLAAQVTALTGVELSAAALRDDPTALAAHLRAHAGATQVLLFVDQFEELFTLSSDGVGQSAFAEALTHAAATTERLRVVITLRDDFLVRAAQVPALRAIASALQILTTPAAADLVRILVEPARRSGFAFEDDDFPGQIISELAEQPGALALLSFTASKLWQLRDRQARHLTRRAYRALGGVGGALAQHAEAVLGVMAEPAQKIVRELFRHLVTADGTRAVLTRNELVEVGGGAAAPPVIEALIGERLLIAMENAGGESIEVVHETLLVSWPRLVRWRGQDAENARLRDQLRSAARQWDERGRPRGMLWRTDALTEYRLWRSRYPGTLTAVEEAFGTTSLADAERGRRWRRFALITAVTALTVALVVFVRLRSDADASRARAQAQLIDSYRDQAERSLASGDSFGALVFAEGAARLGVDSPDHRFVVARALESITPELATMRGHEGVVRSIAFASDGSVVTAGLDGTVRKWSQAGAPLWSVKAFPVGADVAIAADPNGRWIADAAEGDIELRTPDGKLARRLVGHHGQINKLKFAADGKLLSSGFDGTARVWDLERDEVHTLETKTNGEAVTANVGDLVVTAATAAMTNAGADSAFVVWTPSAGPSEPMIIKDALVIAIALSPDGHRLAFGMADGAVEVWDVDARRRLLKWTAHEGVVTVIAFRSDGALISGGADATVKIWNATQGTLLRTLVHRGQVARAAFDAHGHLVTTDVGGTARIWDTESGTNLRTFEHGGGALDLAVSADGHLVATASALGTAKLWNADAPVGVDALDGAAADPTAATPWVDNDGTRLARSSKLGVELWDLTTRRLLLRRGGATTQVQGAGDLVYLVDGRSIALVRSHDGGIARELTAPFDVKAFCIDASSQRLVIADSEHIAVLDATAQIVAQARIDEPIRLICDAGGVATYGKKLTFYDIPGLRVIASEPVTVTDQIAVVIDGVGIVSPYGRDSIAVWRSGRRLTTLQYSGGVEAYAATAATFAVGLYDGTIVERDLGTWAVQREIKGHAAGILVMTSDKDLIVSAGIDGSLKFWGADARAVYETRISAETYWMKLVGGLLISTDGDRVEIRHADRSALTSDQLAVLVACTVPDQVRQQLGGPPRTASCPTPQALAKGER